jgi:hypothetical protein
MSTKTEQKIGEVAIAKLVADGFDPSLVYEEVSVVLDGETVAADIIALHEGEITVLELKSHLDDVLVRQCLRWQGLADYIIGVTMEPRTTSGSHTIRRRRLRTYGIGIYYVGPTTMDMVPMYRGSERTLVIPPRKQDKANHDLILSSLASVRGPAAGSAGVKRIKPDKWECVRDILREGQPMTIGELRNEFPAISRQDWRVFQRAVKNQTVPGITAVPHTTPYKYTMEELL